MNYTSRRMLSSWPKLESATARARRRRERSRKRKKIEKEDEYVAYPPGRPWRVLWPHAHADPMGSPEPKRSIPRMKDWKAAWAQYKATWEDGLRGEPSPEKKKPPPAESTENGKDDNDSTEFQEVRDKASENLEHARQDAQYLLKEAQERTGIKTQDDLRSLATSAMQLATECLKQFMAGYRKGRDDEVDKMLNEYFQDSGNEGKEKPSDEEENTRVRKRRKPKRGIIRE